VVIVLALYFGRVVLIPVTLAMLLSFLLTPLVELLRRLWLGRIVSVLLAVVLALCIIIALGTAIGSQVAHLGSQIPQYQHTIEKKLRDLRTGTVNRLSGRIERLGHQISGAGKPAAAAAATTGPAAQQRPVPVVVMQPTPSALKIGEEVIAPLLSPIATAGIILVVTIFALLQKEDLRDRIIRLFGSGDLRRTTVALNDAARRLSRYFLTQLGINVSFGAIIAVGLYFIGIPNPVLWGILGALLRFVPYIGSWIAALLSMALAAAVTPGWTKVIWTVALYGVTELTMGQAVEPLVYGHSTGLTPIAVVIAAIFWTWIWGPIGLIISTPVTLCLVVLGRHVEQLEFLDILLGDRPALSPVESFYQRILADDPDEAQVQAEAYLKDQPLAGYYDEVAVKGLQLAVRDVAREALSAGKIERIKKAVTELIDELDGEASSAEAPGESQPAARQARGTVLCVPGRGPLDALAADMLHRLLCRHGLRSRIAPNEAVSRTNIRSFAAQDVSMVCITTLGVGIAPAHLRYLLSRLRKRLPGVPLLLGLWPAPEELPNERVLREQIGADRYAATLREAVDACRAQAGLTDRPS
jgi:predicted PurR-regulated permease PerM